MKRFALHLAAVSSIMAQPASTPGLPVAEAEASRCEDRIASVKREILGKYADALAELQVQFQKAADLDGALATRAERERLAKEPQLSEAQFVAEPKGLRAVQQQHVAKMRELIGALVGESVPKLLELKRQLTVAGRLDEAIAVRSAIERLQNDHLPIAKPDADTIVPANDLLTAYAADRARADKTYKGQRIIVRGIVGGFRPDPTDPNNHHLVYLTRGTGAGWVQCAFNSGDVRCREEKQFNNTFLVISNKSGDTVARLQIGQSADIRGTCEGFEEIVRLSKCEVAR